jgi:polyribonucleotide nucleotidyltransferase
MNEMQIIGLLQAADDKNEGDTLMINVALAALMNLTFGSSRDGQELNAIMRGMKTKIFLLHCDFPPYCVKEAGRTIDAMHGEIGHDALAECSFSPVIRWEEISSYSIRIVLDILESTGSSSMASVCGDCPVFTEFDIGENFKKHIILTYIISDEDHFGDMNSKICGILWHIAGFQIDLKIKGLLFEIAKEATYRNREMRAKMLEIMLAMWPQVNKHLNPPAPGFQEVWIDFDKIGAVIGPGGKHIKRLKKSNGAQIDIDEDNNDHVMVFVPN